MLSPIFATDPAYVARFKNEVAQVRKLAHPNIVPIEYFGVEGPYTYFVMPLFNKLEPIDDTGLRPLSR